MGEGVPGLPPSARFNHRGFRNEGLSQSKSFKGPIPLSNFYKIWRGGMSLRYAPSRQTSPLWLLECGLTATEIAKISNFWCKFARKGKFGGPQKLNISAQLQIFLYAVTS